MVASLVILLGLNFATTWYVILFYILKYFGLIIIPIEKWNKRSIKGINKLFAWLLNFNVVITSIILGTYTTITLLQFEILHNVNVDYILNHANNSALMFYSSVFNKFALLAIFNLVIISIIIVGLKNFNHTLKTSNIEEANYESNKAADSIKIAKFDEQKETKNKSKSESIKELNTTTGKDKIFLGHTESKGSIYTALVSPTLKDDSNDKKRLKGATRAEFKKLIQNKESLSKCKTDLNEEQNDKQ